MRNKYLRINAIQSKIGKLYCVAKYQQIYSIICNPYIAAELIKNSKQTYVECLHFEKYSPLQCHSYVHYRKASPILKHLFKKSIYACVPLNNQGNILVHKQLHS